MTPKIERDLIIMLADFNFRLDRIHDDAISNFRTLARSTGQAMRVDRVMK